MVSLWMNGCLKASLDKTTQVVCSFLGAFKETQRYPISRLFNAKRYNKMLKEKGGKLLQLFFAVLAVLADGPPNLLGVFKLLALEGSLNKSLGL